MRSSLATALSCIHLHAEANIGVHDVHHLCSRIPFTVSSGCCVIIPSSTRSAALPSPQVSAVSGWCYGTNNVGG